MVIHRSLLSVIFATAFSTSACANVAPIEPSDKFQHWIENLKVEMLEKGISQKTIDAVYENVYYRPNRQVIKSDRQQLEFVLTSSDYINRVVSKSRVEKGQKLYKELQPILKPIEDKYGVPSNYIIAFWGMETNFGSNFGGFNVIEALTTLSYDNRRPKFFKGELYQALKIIDTWDIDYRQMQGSWAGAMGHFQFMPSTFNAYAVDADNNGTIDIWKSFEDAAASAANYLSTIGWKKDEVWGMPISLPWNFDFSMAGRNKKKSIKEWKKIGIRTTSNKNLPLDNKLKGAIIVPEGKKGHAYLVLNNFYKIMNWNRSENYALGIGTLADYISSGKKWQKLEDNPALRLKTDDVIKVQSFINKLGWFKLEEDGNLGSKTREAVKKLQKEAKMPQDGYPDYQLLEKINNYDAEIGFSIPVPERKLHKKN